MSRVFSKNFLKKYIFARFHKFNEKITQKLDILMLLRSGALSEFYYKE